MASATTTTNAPTAKQPAHETEEQIIVHSAVLEIISQVFGLQDDIENPSKFQRAFIFDAVLSHAKVACNKSQADWTRAVDKFSKLHPTLTREQCELELLVSKKAQTMKRFADKAADLKKTIGQ